MQEPKVKVIQVTTAFSFHDTHMRCHNAVDDNDTRHHFSCDLLLLLLLLLLFLFFACGLRSVSGRLKPRPVTPPTLKTNFFFPFVFS
ncbi:hypothetical protein E2C01_068058 [Portunus trituberculatus]|uniref:Uncharacterized protein n=1 Tax=Portunus trituberculatus TaxID=210409 RepID=A0A5B7HLG2_PORTR|nr:hypothetical protein [Portunus trituberculatus]